MDLTDPAVRAAAQAMHRLTKTSQAAQDGDLIGHADAIGRATVDVDRACAAAGIAGEQAVEAMRKLYPDG